MTQQFDPNQEHDSCNKDWYLVAINPWHKTIFNPVTGQTKHILYKENNE